MARFLAPGELMRVLVVDDHRAMADYLVELLRSHGQNACAAYSPLDALRSAESSQPDAVISDLHMPDMNGFELAHEIAERYPECRIVLMTATPEFRGMTFQNCPFPVLEKTALPDLLFEMLATEAETASAA